VNFEDERYVRLYTRDTVTWKLLKWQGKCLLPLLLRKVDRAGCADLDGAGIEGVAALAEIPLEVVEPGFQQLLERGVVEVRCSRGGMVGFGEREPDGVPHHRSRGVGASASRLSLELVGLVVN
jgi:hypothetical protein